MMQTTETKINERESAIDAEIAETYTAWMVARAEAQRTLESLMYRADWHNKNVRRSNVRSDYKTHLYVDGLRVRATFDVLAPFVGDEGNAKAAAAQRAVDAAEVVYDAVEAQYEGWSRFFLVPAGHIHRSMSCSSCNKGRSATVFSWLTDLSGLGEADAVAAHGAHLCTVCFPTAPVEWHHKEGSEVMAMLEGLSARYVRDVETVTLGIESLPWLGQRAYGGASTVASSSWAVSYASSSKEPGYELSAFRFAEPSGSQFERHDLDGTRYDTIDEAQSAAYGAGLIAYFFYDLRVGAR